jgi:hypothetical protein
MYHLLVRSIDSVVSAIDITPTDTVVDVKDDLIDKTGVPTDQIWLSSAGRILNDGWSVEDCGFHE